MRTAYSPVNHIFVKFSQVPPESISRLFLPYLPAPEMLSTASQICQKPTLESGLAGLL